MKNANVYSVIMMSYIYMIVVIATGILASLGIYYFSRNIVFTIAFILIVLIGAPTPQFKDIPKDSEK